MSILYHESHSRFGETNYTAHFGGSHFPVQEEDWRKDGSQGSGGHLGLYTVSYSLQKTHQMQCHFLRWAGHEEHQQLQSRELLFVVAFFILWGSGMFSKI